MEFNDSATHGLNITVTDLWIAAAKSNEVRQGRDPNRLMAMLLDSEKAFTVLRGSFTALLTTYHPNNCYSAADVMHAVFSSARGSKTAFNHDKIEAVHEMLQLKQGEALLNQGHPVCQDWPPEAGGGIRRIFAAGPKLKAYTPVFGRNMPQALAQFSTVLLGKPAQRSLLLYRMVSSNLCSLFARQNPELEAGPWRR